jgi:hypothetical protein
MHRRHIVPDFPPAAGDVLHNSVCKGAAFVVCEAALHARERFAFIILIRHASLLCNRPAVRTRAKLVRTGEKKSAAEAALLVSVFTV